jgi:serine protease Do
MLGCFIGAGVILQKHPLASPAPSTTVLPSPLVGVQPSPGQPILKNLDDSDRAAIIDATCTVKTNDGTGSSVFISRDGLALTNAHVVGDNTAVQLQCYRQSPKPCRVVKLDKVNDLALIKVEGDSVNSAIALAPVDVQPGDRVTAIGSPRGKLNTVTRGVVNMVNAPTVPEQPSYTVRTNAISQPGSSGGALLNERGELAGITSAGDGKVTASIPASKVKEFLESR